MILAALLLAALPQVAPPPPLAVEEPPAPTVTRLPAVSGAAPAWDPFLPVATLTPPGGPRIVRLGALGSDVVAMRLSVPLQEDNSEAGAGRLLQLLAVERAVARAAAAGVPLEGVRTPWGVAYTVVGARIDFDFLAYVLREAVAEPRPSEVDFQRHRAALQSDILSVGETPGARLIADLRTRVAPGSAPLGGTPTSLSRLSASSLRELWVRTHRPEAMTLVIAGDIGDEVVLSAFRGLPQPPGPVAERSPSPVPAQDVRGTQVLRHWYGEAFPISSPRDPHTAVAALLAADQLRDAGEPFEAEVQLWELPGAQAIAVLAAAYPQGAARMRSRLPTLMRDTLQRLSPELVRDAVARVRSDWIQSARTPVGLVTVLGLHLDASGDAGSARSFLNQLDGVTVESTAAFLTRVEGRTPVRTEIRP